jgi:predicted aldo/keto reductase-like oxidoreductase
MDCPEGVEIPKTIDMYNDFQRMNSIRHPLAGRMYSTETGLLSEREQPSSCKSCGVCRDLCPQHIDIPNWMGEIAAFQKTMGVHHR